MATGLATEHQEVTGADGGPIRVELEAALKKVYGDVVDVEATKILTTANSESTKEGQAGGGVSTTETTPL
jgi:hypothetical protein